MNSKIIIGIGIAILIIGISVVSYLFYSQNESNLSIGNSESPSDESGKHIVIELSDSVSAATGP